MQKISFLILLNLLGLWVKSQDDDKTFKFIVGIPFFNASRMEAFDTTRNNTGIFGQYVGLDYGNSEGAWYITAGGCFCEDIAEHFGAYVQESVLFLNLGRKQFIGKRIELGGGLNLSRYNWKFRNLDSLSHLDRSTHNYALGLNFSANYLFSRFFYGGIMYMPTWFSFKDGGYFRNQQYFSVVLGFRLGKNL